ncbi:CoA transferase [Burkholderia sp. BCC1993]|uniref:CaiB/BaiF CoA transferase family protein n=1 Tax=Burkholderia sp. BCC1993 TaxID=2817444 RepID=UPI002AB06E2D|nr:CoA transferase [Burkholderia sp. BCC1993]
MEATESIFSTLKVVDFASYVAGPAATTILSDFGATVVKIEPPGAGDPYRHFYKAPPNPASEYNYPWQLTNRNKQSLALDLKSPDARDVVARLIKWADVAVVNFPPSVKEKLGLTYGALSALNERLVYADITGYGARGPEADKPGFDVTAYWARSGLMDITRDGNSPPAVPVPGIGDHAAACTLYSAIVTGLYRREKTGKGSHVTTSLIAQGAWASAMWVEGGLNGARFDRALNRETPQNALFNPYRTADGRWLLLILLQDKDWQGFARAMQLAFLLTDARFADGDARAKNASILVGILDHAFAQHPLVYWKALFDECRVVYGVAQNMEEIVNDEQMYANDIFVPLVDPCGDATHTVSSPLQIAGVTKVAPRRAPYLGEHSRSVLRQLGYDDIEIDRLIAGQAVAQGTPAH